MRNKSKTLSQGNPHDCFPGHEKFSLKVRFRSLGFAFNGLRLAWQQEHNFRIHGVLTLLVMGAGFIFRISLHEWLAVLTIIGLVLSLELINTTIEHLADFVAPGIHPAIKTVKDLSAAGVLVAALIAVIIGFLIFIPKIAQTCCLH